MTDQDIERVLQIARLATAISSMMKIRMERAMPELTARSLNLMQSIAQHPEMMIKDHANEIGLPYTPNIIASLEGPESDGLIQRWTPPKKKMARGVHYRITTRGKSALADARQKAGAAALPLIGSFETKELYRVLGEALKDAAGR